MSKIGKILLGNKTLAIKKALIMHVVTWHGDGHPFNVLPWTCISTLNVMDNEIARFGGLILFFFLVILSELTHN